MPYIIKIFFDTESVKKNDFEFIKYITNINVLLNSPIRITICNPQSLCIFRFLSFVPTISAQKLCGNVQHHAKRMERVRVLIFGYKLGSAENVEIC